MLQIKILIVINRLYDHLPEWLISLFNKVVSLKPEILLKKK